ncbi:fructosamine kinase family protein [Saccharophagus degradans]|uniref:Fructosamine kinase family protein n=1 Tax=Saccharophagus degradans TaxID=86304 RepID=A0AAW7X5H4_9GAMM|nr:fructosamine kinase family protein [Saccharophagus degradans]MDO6422649.1 fructosamine kinase family protein [Saccharophagus degradans]MDO6609043.1 fructosamine kinase family protein [Saccharophagus degradans]
MAANQSFIKHNSQVNSNTLLVEASGLALLSKTLLDNSILGSELCIPKVLAVNKNQLEIEYIQSLRPSDSHFKTLGVGLAKLHTIQQPHFGLEHDNYIGLNPQPNCISHNWGQFFYQYRLQFQVSLIADSYVKQRFQTLLHTHQAKLIEFLNSSCSSPSLVHGDLWSGNVLFDKQRVWLIDPAVYYADSEVDIAMTEMFGGFDAAFYQAYQTVRPFTAQYPIKKRIYNAYHYLNHYNLFGDNYLAGCKQGLGMIEAL